MDNKYQLIKTAHDPLRVFITNLHPKIQNFDSIVFDGEIRNYNELKFIMDRTGINSKE